MAGTRTYAGATAEQRAAHRRTQLIEAGLELIGTRGYDATTVKDVCAQAGLTERYFYESFTDRTDLLAAVYEEVIAYVFGGCLEAVAAAPDDVEARARAGLDAFVRALTDDPRRARVQLVEVVGRSPALETRRREVMGAFADLIAAQADDLLGSRAAREPQRHLGALAMVGATHELVVEWTQTTSAATLEELIDVLVRLYSAAATALGSPRGAPARPGVAGSAR